MISGIIAIFMGILQLITNPMYINTVDIKNVSIVKKHVISVEYKDCDVLITLDIKDVDNSYIVQVSHFDTPEEALKNFKLIRNNLKINQ